MKTATKYGIAACMGLLLVAGRVYADRLARPYDWTVELQTKRLQHQFEYTGSHLHGVEKVHVTYVHTATASDPDPHPTDYEDFWYHDGKPLGLERKHSFDIDQGDGISILVSHKDGSATDQECKAAANAILRATVDSYLNKNAILQVRVEPDSFDRIKQDLIDQGCLEHEPTGDDGHPITSAIQIFLQTEPDADRSYTLYYI